MIFWNKKKNEGPWKTYLDVFLECSREGRFPVLMLLVASIITIALITGNIAGTIIPYVFLILALAIIIAAVFYLIDFIWKRKVEADAIKSFHDLKDFLRKKHLQEKAEGESMGAIINGYTEDLKTSAEAETTALRGFLELKKETRKQKTEAT